MKTNEELTKIVEAQAKLIIKLGERVDDLEKEQKKLVQEDKKLILYVNRLMSKADNLFKNKFEQFRRVTVQTNARVNHLDSEVSNINGTLNKR